MIVRRLTLLAVLCLSAFLALSTVEAPPAKAHGHMHCNEVNGGPTQVGFGIFDPIVAPGLEPFGHEHMFFNNGAMMLADGTHRANSTYQTLSGATDVNCENKGDTASYWVPSVYQKWTDAQGQPHWTRLNMHASIFYYRTWTGRLPDQTQADIPAGYPDTDRFPPDMRLISGDPSATAPQPTSVVNWTCNVNSSRVGPWNSAVQAACDTATGNIVRLGFRVDFGTCWDGVLNQKTGPGNTADATFGRTADGMNDHVVFATGTATNPTCPVGYTAGRLPFLRMDFQLEDRFGADYQGNGQDIFLGMTAGSDNIFGTADDVKTPGPDGISGTADDVPETAEQSQWKLHGDFWNTWVDDVLNSQLDLRGLVNRCINLINAAPEPHPHGSSTVCGT